MMLHNEVKTEGGFLSLQHSFNTGRSPNTADQVVNQGSQGFCQFCDHLSQNNAMDSE